MFNHNYKYKLYKNIINMIATTYGVPVGPASSLNSVWIILFNLHKDSYFLGLLNDLQKCFIIISVKTMLIF